MLACQCQKRKGQTKGGGPSGYVIKYHNLGNALVNVVHRNFKERNLTHTNAAKLLGTKVISVPSFLDHVERAKRQRMQGNGGLA